MAHLKFIGLFTLSHGSNRNQQEGHVPFMWPTALCSGLVTLSYGERQGTILEDGYHHTVVWQRYCRKLTFGLLEGECV